MKNKNKKEKKNIYDHLETTSKLIGKGKKMLGPILGAGTVVILKPLAVKALEKFKG